MKIFIVLNEGPSNPCSDVRNVFDLLTSDGVIRGYEIFPFLALLEAGLRSEEVMRELLRRATLFGPDAILWAHTGGLYVTEYFITQIRQKCDNPVFGYWDGDLYEAPFKRLPEEIVQLASCCNVTFVQGFGAMSNELAASGCADIRFVPATTDEWRFGDRRTSSRDFDVVLIGNNVSSRFPWRTMPGARWRKKLVKLFERKLGRRFAVFGEGWCGPSAHGPLPFEDQSYAYGRGCVALGVNNLHGAYYFSNRLPIAMSSCVPVIYNYERGFEHVFPRNSGCLFFHDTEQAWDLAQKLLCGDADRVSSMGELAQGIATRQFNITKVIRYMCDVLETFGQCDTNSRVHPRQSLNPWLD